MAHGISGPIALLALAMRRGIAVNGHAVAIDRICQWLFAFNRLGIAAQHQHVLGTAASRVILQQEIVPGPALTSGSGRSHWITVSAVTTDTTNTTTADPEQLREALVAFIDGFGTFRTTQVKAAFRTVPRHLFLPGVDLTAAYAPKPVVTKRADDGTAVSSASSPHVVATMLEQLDVAPGHRVLEIGAATGINAALLAEMAGPTGTVVTIELDDDLAAGALPPIHDAVHQESCRRSRPGSRNGGGGTAPRNRRVFMPSGTGNPTRQTIAKVYNVTRDNRKIAHSPRDLYHEPDGCFQESRHDRRYWEFAVHLAVACLRFPESEMSKTPMFPPSRNCRSHLSGRRKKDSYARGIR